MVSEALRERLLPFVNREYGNQGAVTLEEDVYVEHYQAYHEVGNTHGAALGTTHAFTSTFTLRVVALRGGGGGCYSRPRLCLIFSSEVVLAFDPSP